MKTDLIFFILAKWYSRNAMILVYSSSFIEYQQGCKTIYFHLKIAVDQNLKIFTSNHFENKLWSLSKTTPQTRVSIVCYLSIINCASISISSVHHSAITVFTVFCTIHNIRAQNLYIGLYVLCRYVYIVYSHICIYSVWLCGCVWMCVHMCSLFLFPFLSSCIGRM